MYDIYITSVLLDFFRQGIKSSRIKKNLVVKKVCFHHHSNLSQHDRIMKSHEFVMQFENLHASPKSDLEVVATDTSLGLHQETFKAQQRKDKRVKHFFLGVSCLTILLALSIGLGIGFAQSTKNADFVLSQPPPSPIMAAGSYALVSVTASLAGYDLTTFTAQIAAVYKNTLAERLLIPTSSITSKYLYFDQRTLNRIFVCCLPNSSLFML